MHGLAPPHPHRIDPMPPASSTARRFRPLLLVLALVVATAGAGAWYALGREKPAPGGDSRPAGETKPAAVGVEVVHPRPGGIERVSTQPGTVEPCETVDLYARVSGYLAEQSVDIGTRVKAGDVIARIAVPEHEKQVKRDTAKVKDAEAKVRQAEARVAAARAERRAAEAAVALSKVLVRAKTAYRQYREKQLTRMKDLASQKAIEARVVDEQEDYYLSALEAENGAKEGVNSATERATAALAKVTEAEADVDVAKAQVGVAAADLEKSQVMLDFAVITAPYTGVVTRRNFYPPRGFVKAADQGGTVPLLTVERTDVMRVVVQVPDRDVPYVHKGAPAVVEIDALPEAGAIRSGDGRTVAVSRWATAEDPASRTMRTEIDVPNPDGKLAHGMYGRVTLTLSPGTPNAVRVPSAALVGKAEGGRGSVRVVRGDTARLVPVRYATDNGIEVEIVSGLTAADDVIVRASGPVEDGTAVAVSESHVPPAAGH